MMLLTFNAAETSVVTIMRIKMALFKLLDGTNREASAAQAG
jgi:hypothetical protein